jgi:hypothetical protein
MTHRHTSPFRSPPVQRIDQYGKSLAVSRGQHVSFDVWIDEAGTMRRMAFAFDPQEGDGSFRARVDVRKVGAKLDVQVPTGQQVVDLQDLEPPA